MHLPDHTRLLFIGDSITDFGREPVGEPAPWSGTALDRVHPQQAGHIILGRAFLAKLGAL